MKSSKRMRYDVSWLDGGVGKMAELTNTQSYQSFGVNIAKMYGKAPKIWQFCQGQVNVIK